MYFVWDSFNSSIHLSSLPSRGHRFPKFCSLYIFVTSRFVQAFVYPVIGAFSHISHTGSNNLNLLLPIGQFGTRLCGGKDAASARYIFTALNPVTRLIFHPADDPILTYLRDDNLRIEPEWYCPIIPMILINGADGIGTGYATRIPNYDVLEVIANLYRMLDGESPLHMMPNFRGFRGTIQVGAFFLCVLGYSNDGIFE